MGDAVAAFNLAVSWGLLVLVWLVQVIIYPSLGRIPSTGFPAYHRWYTLRIAAIVIPLMIAEAAGLAAWLASGAHRWLCLLSIVLTATVWLSTAFFQVPMHRRLRLGREAQALDRLVTTNWVRTLAWSLKTAAVTLAAV